MLRAVGQGVVVFGWVGGVGGGAVVVGGWWRWVASHATEQRALRARLLAALPADSCEAVCAKAGRGQDRAAMARSGQSARRPPQRTVPRGSTAAATARLGRR